MNRLMDYGAYRKERRHGFTMLNIVRRFYTPAGLALLEGAKLFAGVSPMFTGASHSSIFFKWPIGPDRTSGRIDWRRMDAHEHREEVIIKKEKENAQFPAKEEDISVFMDWCLDQGYEAWKIRKRGSLDCTKVTYVLVYLS